MNLFLELLPTFIIAFATSFLINIFRDGMEHSSASPDVLPVEVININDLSSRR